MQIAPTARIARYAVLAVALAAALALPRSAPAQTGDPAEGSPSGVIYEIPLDNARHDAAPSGRRHGRGSGQGAGGAGAAGGGARGGGGAGAGAAGGAGGAGGGAGGTVSPIRSENGFGSSSAVPGAIAPSAAKHRARGHGKATKAAGGTASGGTARGTEASSGSEAGATAEGLRASGSAAVTPSRSRAYLLLLLALVVAAGLGIAGRYVARRR
jgi:hypothetical protein